MRILVKSRCEVKDFDCLILPIFKGKDFSSLKIDYPELEPLIRKYKFKGDTQDGFTYFSSSLKKWLMVAGAGSHKELVDIRKCAREVMSRLNDHPVSHALVQFYQPMHLDTSHLVSFIDYLLLNEYKFDGYLSGKKKPSLKKLAICFKGKKQLINKTIQERLLVGRNTSLVRDWVNDIPARVNPDFMVEEAKKIAREHSLECDILRSRELRDRGMSGILAVGNSSPYEPALIQLHYKPKNASRKVAIVGKGITFDSGGLNIKTGNHMTEMKCDMAGAATVMGIIKTAAALELPVEILALAAVAENMPGQDAYKPGDILTFKNKKTVEVLNTDAEGRLALADALLVAAEAKPDYLIEFSTLTGAVVIALGDSFAGLVGNNHTLNAILKRSGQETGDLVWEMPFFEDYRKSIKSKIADLKNANYNGASSIKAGMFLQEFTGKTPFAHVDIAGTAFISRSNVFYSQEGATGFGLRMMIHFLQSLI